MLPTGYLSTQGSQIVDSRGRPVRIACIGGFGTNVADSPPDYYDVHYPFKGLDANIDALKRIGFNCVRADFNDKNANDPAMMAQFDALVVSCKKYGVKVIFDHHNNEATTKDWGNAAQQKNGLWFDSGPGTDGTDGAGDKGTITQDIFQQDWVAFAKHWAGNSTVIGFDLDNEPHTQYGHNSGNWGNGGPCDICAMYSQVGSAIQKVNPGALIICESFCDVTDKSSLIWWSGELTHVPDHPVVLAIPDKLVYSVHEYPWEVSGQSPSHLDYGPTYINYMNVCWGFIVEQNIAPIWVGEMGTSGNNPNDQAWAKTITDYMDGLAPGGPTFSGNQQPIGGDWWWWCSFPQAVPDGCLTDTGAVRPEQAQFIDALLFRHQASKAR
jgi:endoglucanase